MNGLIISIMTNKSRFNQLEYNTEPIIKEANFDYMFLPVQNQLLEYIISKSEVDRDDNLFIALQGITNVEGELVQAQIGSKFERMLFDTSKNARLQIMYSVSHDVTVINRSVYNTFMLLGDLGGLSGLLYTVGAFITSLLTYQSPENKLVEKLFVYSSVNFRQEQNELDSRKFSALKEYFKDLLPKPCLCRACNRRNSHDEQFKRAREWF